MLRERLGFLIMVAILIFLFAVVFAILGKGEYEPSDPHDSGNVRSAAVSA